MKLSFGFDQKVYSRLLFLSSSHSEHLNSNYFSHKPDHDALPYMDSLLKNHSRCPYWSLLKRYCPSSVDNNMGKIPQQQLIAEFTPKGMVFLYVRSVLLKLFPAQLFGSSDNFNGFLKQVKLLLSLQFYDSISIHHMTQDIQCSKMIWLQSLDSCQQERRLEQTVHYIIVKIIGPLVQSFFYVTESGTFKNRVFFFRKKTWIRLTQIATSKFINLCHLKKVTPEWVEKKRKQGICLNVSSIRFLMKKSGLRTITNMSKKGKGLCINKQLKTILAVLTFERQNSPESFGSTVTSLDEVYLKWKEFVNKVKKCPSKHVYFVKVDIEKCFDTINICLLYSIVEKLFTQQNYTIHKCRKSVKINGIRKTVYFECVNKDNGCSLELCGSYIVSKTALLEKLGNFLFNNVMKVGRHHYVQTLGIAQGSSLSSLLCGAYHAHLEKTMLGDFVTTDDLLIRMVDDILFVSLNKETALTFVKTFLEGFPEYNCKSNLTKCVANFEYVHSIFGQVPIIEKNSPLCFCGVGFNTQTLEVLLDFTNYKGIHTRDTVSVHWTKHAEKSLKQKMTFYVHPKCLCILFDKDINTLNSICHNLMCIFAVAATKFHCLVKILPFEKSISQNQKLFIDIIEDQPRELIQFISRKMRKLSDEKFIFPLSLKTVRHICRQTYLNKLQGNRSLYYDVIDHLNACLGREKLTMNITSKLPAVYREIQLK